MNYMKRELMNIKAKLMDIKTKLINCIKAKFVNFDEEELRNNELRNNELKNNECCFKYLFL